MKATRNKAPYEKLREYLDSHGIKYGYVSDLIGMPNTTFSELLSGKRKMTVDDVVNLCNALHISAETIIETDWNKTLF